MIKKISRPFPNFFKLPLYQKLNRDERVGKRRQLPRGGLASRFPLKLCAPSSCRLLRRCGRGPYFDWFLQSKYQGEKLNL